VVFRAGRRTGRRQARPSADAASADTTPAPPGRTRRLSRPPAWVALVIAVAVGLGFAIAPARGASDNLAPSFLRVLLNPAPVLPTGEDFAGTPAVGALFTMPGGRLGSHFCTASVIDSPNGDLVITAAHCVSRTAAEVAFVPGYNAGAAPYGVWIVTQVYVDASWRASSDPDDDVAFLRVSQPGTSVPIEDVTGAERLRTGAPARQLVEVIGYPDSADQAITCRNWTREPMADQLEFDCGGYTDGTSGGPFLAGVDPRTGHGTVVGVIGGYEQGGLTPQVSYSAMFGANVMALYEVAVAGG
jgi:V8-like Glu-specific endopeptidase